MSDIDYNVVKSSKATEPRIDVNIREVKIVVPEGSDIDPDQLAEEKKDWIQEKKEKFDAFKQEAPERNFDPGEKFLYLGKEHELKLGAIDKVKINKSVLKAPYKDTQDSLAEFYKEEARKYIRPRVEEYAEKMGVEFNSMALRNQRTLWGSCSPKQNLSFNWRLMMAPADVIDYVIVHELAHLKVKNHTKKFWRLVGDYHDNYQECSQWLEENSPRLIFTREDL
jgi:hypothetical protein